MTEIKALIFDKDGTLFDFAQTWQCWADGFLLRLANGERSAADRYGQAIGYDLAARRFALATRFAVLLRTVATGF